MEIGQALHRLGSSVRIIKKHDTIARGIEREVGIKFQNILILALPLLFNSFSERFHEFVEGN